MRKILFFVLVLFSVSSFGQKNYFQQGVSYSIDVTLYDQSHILRGYERLTYINNSTDTLKYLFFHLWPNAYKNDKTAFTAHQVENKEKDFYFSDENDRGFIDSLDFKVDGDPVNVSEYNNHQDIVMIELNKPLLPSQQIDITTPFRLVIPEVFSRLGHDGQQYQISQWYPKPAVYDLKGWHPMPYLDQGEFYSEIGSYEVNITLPKNYVVAATGNLQQPEEFDFMKKRTLSSDSNFIQKDNSNNESSSEMKTLIFKQQNVHDFAWFASKEYLIEKTEVELASGRKVMCYSFFKPQNEMIYKGSSQVTAKTIRYFSDHVGEYPYNQVSVVDGKLLAGGGMEYPNVTVIGRIDNKSMLQTVIIHEVGHNWFYGLLASNERDHPWMDEGINSFYEGQLDRMLTRELYPDGMQSNNLGDRIGDKLNGPFIYQFFATQRIDQPIDIKANEFTKMNYGGIVYKKSHMMLDYLQAYLGQEVFERAMKRYYAEWHFKHPYPEDFRKIIESESGKKLAWFFEDGLNTTKKIDFKIMRIQKSSESETLVYAKSNTDFKGPIPVTASVVDSVYATQWVEYPYDKPVSFETGLKKYVYSIDAKRQLPEINVFNNAKSGIGLKLKLGFGLGLREKNELFMLPAFGFNFYDKAMLGLVLHNLRWPNSKFQFALAPMFSIGTKSLVGSGILGFTFYPKGSIHKVTLALKGRSYHHQESNLNISDPLFLRHIRVSPSVTFDFKPNVARSPIADQIVLEYFGILNQQFNYTRDPIDSLFRPSIDGYAASHLGRISFIHKNNRTFHPYSYRFVIDGNHNFLKLGLTGNLRIDYHLKDKSFYARGFAGKFFNFNNAENLFALRQQYFASTYTATNDMMYNDVFVARNEQTGTLSQQISMREGGFKIRTNQYANPIGISNNWMTAINLRSDLPVKFPIKIQAFIDAGTFADAGKLNPSGNKLLFDGGLEFHFINDMLIVYAPLFMSKDFKDYTKTVYAKNRLLNTMTFSLNIAQLNFLNTNNATKLIGF
jgi:hypothetical protein